MKFAPVNQTTIRNTALLLAAILALLSLTACGGSDPTAATTPTAQAEGEHGAATRH